MIQLYPFFTPLSSIKITIFADLNKYREKIKLHGGIMNLKKRIDASFRQKKVPAISRNLFSE